MLFRLILLATMMSLYSAGGARADMTLPFSPVSKTVDHVVTMKGGTNSGLGGSTVRTVTRHGSKVRVDGIANELIQTTYFDFSAALHATILRDTNGRTVNINLKRSAKNYSQWASDGVKTDEIKNIIGENCDVWEISQKLLLSHSGTYKSCLTVDGLEIWRGFSHSGIIETLFEAVSIVRSPVTLADASPPHDLLDQSEWLLAPLDQRGAGSQVVLAWDDPTISTAQRFGSVLESINRLGDWSSSETVTQTGYRYRYIKNKATGLSISIEQYSNNEFGELSISLPRSLSDQNLFGWPVAPRRLRAEHEFVLGERCSWFDPTPGLSHSIGWCQADDGVILKTKSLAFANTSKLTAVTVRRGELAFREIMPPPVALSPETWGLSG